jgi:hypothetical protein
VDRETGARVGGTAMTLVAARNAADGLDIRASVDSYTITCSMILMLADSTRRALQTIIDGRNA